MKHNQDVLDDWVERCLTEGKGLTDWERSFCESVSEQLDRIGRISERQEEILERIYADKTA